MPVFLDSNFLSRQMPFPGPAQGSKLGLEKLSPFPCRAGATTCRPGNGVKAFQGRDQGRAVKGTLLHAAKFFQVCIAHPGLVTVTQELFKACPGAGFILRADQEWRTQELAGFQGFCGHVVAPQGHQREPDQG